MQLLASEGDSDGCSLHDSLYGSAVGHHIIDILPRIVAEDGGVGRRVVVESHDEILLVGVLVGGEEEAYAAFLRLAVGGRDGLVDLVELVAEHLPCGGIHHGELLHALVAGADIVSGTCLGEVVLQLASEVGGELVATIGHFELEAVG